MDTAMVITITLEEVGHTTQQGERGASDNVGTYIHMITLDQYLVTLGASHQRSVEMSTWRRLLSPAPMKKMSALARLSSLFPMTRKKVTDTFRLL